MTPTKEYLLKLGEIDPEFAEYVRTHPQNADHASLEDRQAMSERLLGALRTTLEDPGPGIKKTSLPYPTRDGTHLPALLYQPDPPPADGPPIVMLLHGGGFAVGGPELEELNCRQLVRELGVVCYAVSYRLAPAHRFPTAHEDAWDALRFVAATAASWGADPARGFVVGGTSAGGNLAAGLACRARDEALRPALTGQWLACPWVCPRGRIGGWVWGCGVLI